MDRWEVCSIAVSTPEERRALDKVLARGWEPFAVTQGPTIYHLRRVRPMTGAEWVAATQP